MVKKEKVLLLFFLILIAPHLNSSTLTDSIKKNVVNKTDENGTGLLYKAVVQKSLKTAQKLLDAGASVNQQDQDGSSPLLIASQNGHLEMVELLVNKGADVNLAMKNGSTPLHVAAQDGHDSVVKFLLHAKVNPLAMTDISIGGLSALHYAVENGHLTTAKILLDSGIPIDQAAKDGKTPLLLAAGKGDYKTVSFLISNKANVNLISNIQGKVKITPLGYAMINTKGKDLSVIELILKSGAKPDEVIQKDVTAFTIADELKRKDMRDLLNKFKK